MDHDRIVRAVLGVSAGYVVLLALWAGWIIGLLPRDTVPYQVTCLVGLFGSFLGIGMRLAMRPTRADRKLRRHGLEGWARIEGMHPLRRTDHHTVLTELNLELTVPGSATYTGRVIYDVAPVVKEKLAIGEVISIRVDPADRDRIILLPLDGS